jgi:chromosome condensin MukBEF ATPase and DNA-binding subunit MukB
MRSLRLHKYNSVFERMNWRQMIILSDEQLEQMGVAALGARRKMLKVFEAVKRDAVEQVS